MVMNYEWTRTEEDARARLHVEEEDFPAFSAAFARAKAAFAPRAARIEASIDALGEDFAYLSGEWFEGARLAACLRDASRAWAYVATAGEKPAAESDDPLVSWWMQALGEDAVSESMRRLTEDTLAAPGKCVGSLSPGSLEGWPIEQQRPLFALLGGEAEALGVTLTDCCLMLPRHSVSGIFFETAKPFCACSHCPRGGCPNRRAEQSADVKR